MPNPTQPSFDLELRTGLGRAYLNSDQVDKAIDTFIGILRDYPMEIDVSICLGDCYLAYGKTEIAARLYAQALKFKPGNHELIRKLNLAQQEKNIAEENCSNGEIIPADIEVIGSLLQRRMNRSEPISKDEISRVADLLQKFIKSSHPALEVSVHLDQVDDLLFALLELNIQQARADGQPDLAQALQNLADNMYLQIKASSDFEHLPIENNDLENTPHDFRTLFLCQYNGQLPPRLALAAESLSSRGCEVSILTDLSLESIIESDIICVSQPHVDSKIMGSLIEVHANGTPIILDLEADFEQMPVEHRDYEYLGLSTLSKTQAYATALSLADQICVHSTYLASVLQNNGYRSKVIPEGWSNQDDLWKKPSVSRHTLNIGWLGTNGQIEDISPIRRIITRVLREFPQVVLVVGGDPDVYRIFDSIPESRRLFLPNVSYEYFPFLFSQIDVLLNPLRSIAYNHSLSDRLLMEAGVRHIPWISSPLPTVIGWAVGGMIANTPEEWHSHLRQLVLDSDIRNKLGDFGRQKAEKREMNCLTGLWYRTICDTWHETKKTIKNE